MHLGCTFTVTCPAASNPVPTRPMAMSRTWIDLLSLPWGFRAPPKRLECPAEGASRCTSDKRQCPILYSRVFLMDKLEPHQPVRQPVTRVQAPEPESHSVKAASHSWHSDVMRASLLRISLKLRSERVILCQVSSFCFSALCALFGNPQP